MPLHTVVAAPPLASGSLFQDQLKVGGLAPKMVVIAAGTFLMGSPQDEQSHQKNESPQQKITLPKNFAIGQTEITAADYDLFLKHTKPDWIDDRYKQGRGNQPVIFVSWDDAETYTTWLSEQTGFHYRLPTEAEWEYAARAGTTTAYSFGNDHTLLDQYGWFGERRYQGSTHPVAQKKPNAWNLYDMHGNVWEWTSDCAAGAIQNELCLLYMVRGGAWRDRAGDLRSASRFGHTVYTSDGMDNDLGFRVVRELF